MKALVEILKVLGAMLGFLVFKLLMLSPFFLGMAISYYLYGKVTDGTTVLVGWGILIGIAVVRYEWKRWRQAYQILDDQERELGKPAGE